jgi:pimeloyl-ACP methyl ester carboxylesterase
MAAVGIVALVLPLLAVIVALGWMVLPYRQLLGALDLKRLYLCMVSLLALVLAAVALLLAVQVATRMLLGADPAAGLLPAGSQQGRSDQPWEIPPSGFTCPQSGVVRRRSPDVAMVLPGGGAAKPFQASLDDSPSIPLRRRRAVSGD